MLMLESVVLWLDASPRSGYENMAIDEFLLSAPEPWLRVYSWARPSVSFGYFDTMEEAERIFPSGKGERVEYIRRWTGGGIVDHRIGVTYTLALPPRPGAPYPESSVLYRVIHGALAQALQAVGVSCRLLEHDAPDGGRSCWASPVESDVVDDRGRKLAGAGQRRYRGGVLHQGLIQQCAPSPEWPYLLARALAKRVCTSTLSEAFPGADSAVRDIMASKYESAMWSDESRGRRRLLGSGVAKPEANIVGRERRASDRIGR